MHCCEYFQPCWFARTGCNPFAHTLTIIGIQSLPLVVSERERWIEAMTWDEWMSLSYIYLCVSWLKWWPGRQFCFTVECQWIMLNSYSCEFHSMVSIFMKIRLYTVSDRTQAVPGMSVVCGGYCRTNITPNRHSGQPCLRTCMMN